MVKSFAPITCVKKIENYKNDNIIFHDERAEAKDWIVNQAYAMSITCVLEVEYGTENLWENENPNGRTEFSNFGWHLIINCFKCFMTTSSYSFCDKNYWCVDKRNTPWNMAYLSLISATKEKSLIKAVLLILCKIMIE